MELLASTWYDGDQAERHTDRDALRGDEPGLDEERPAHHRRREAHGPQHPDLASSFPDGPHHDHAESGDADEQPESEIALHQPEEPDLLARLLVHDFGERTGVDAVGQQSALQPCRDRVRIGAGAHRHVRTRGQRTARSHQPC